jgi:Toxin co-regulated pilus biosynthesis protein Q
MDKVSKAAKVALYLGAAIPALTNAATVTSVPQVPLVSAVGKLIPQDDLVLYSSAVNQSQMVEPVNAADWHDALSAMLQPLGLTFSNEGQLIRIGTLADIGASGQPGYNLVAGQQRTVVKTLYQGQQVSTPGFSLTSQPVGAVPELVDTAPVPATIPASKSVTWLKPLSLINTANGQMPVQNVTAEPSHPALGQNVAQSTLPTPLFPLGASNSQSALTSPTATNSVKASTPTQAAPPPVQVWTLQAGELASKNLIDWGAQAGWQVTWNFPKDVVIAHAATFKGAFPDAAAQVVVTLRQQMQQFDPSTANIHYDTYPPNRQFVVDSYNAGGN